MISSNYNMWLPFTYIGLPHLPRTTPVISGCFFPSLEQNSMSSTESSRTVRVEYFLISSCMLVRYWSLSICALNPHTAGPFLLFSARYWMPDTSARRHCQMCIVCYYRLMARIASLLLTYHTLFHTAHPEHQFLSSSVLYLCHQTKDYRTSHLDGKIRQMTMILHHMIHHETHEKYFSYTWLVLLPSLTNQTTPSTAFVTKMLHTLCSCNAWHCTIQLGTRLYPTVPVMLKWLWSHTHLNFHHVPLMKLVIFLYDLLLVSHVRGWGCSGPVV